MDFTTIANFIMSHSIVIIFFCVAFLFYRIQSSAKLDFADMLTKDGRAISLTKVLQLIGGLTGTWVIVTMTLANTLSVEFLLAYLSYVGSIEAFSKFVSAKYNYKETSIKDAKKEDE